MKTEKINFVAINTITAESDYRDRFEELFKSRAHAIDRMDGFQSMHVLKPSDGEGNYLIVSYWDSEEHFKNWTGSAEFKEGHKRGFADLIKARKEGKKPPMTSGFKTYTILTR